MGPIKDLSNHTSHMRHCKGRPRLSDDPVPGIQRGYFFPLCKFIKQLQEQESDESLAVMIKYLTRLSVESLCWKAEIIDGVLQFENPAFPGRYCFVMPESLHSSILAEAHSSCFGGHFIERKVYDRLRRFVWW